MLKNALRIFLPKMSAYRRDFDLKDDKLLEKYNKICEKVKNNLKKEYNTMKILKYLKANIKYYNRKINTNFHKNKIPKEGSQCILLFSNFD